MIHRGLGLVWMLGASSFSLSCLVNAPAELEAEQQIPPKFLVETAIPPTFQLVPTDSETVQEFVVSYTSEDLNENVLAKLYLNWDTGEPSPVIGTSQQGPHSIDDGPIEMSVAWTRLQDRPPGCYAVTMVISHASNFDSGGFEPIPKDPSKADYITWWVAHRSPPQDITLDQCPRPGEGSAVP